jgi:hypothetical protein
MHCDDSLTQLFVCLSLFFSFFHIFIERVCE